MSDALLTAKQRLDRTGQRHTDMKRNKSYKERYLKEVVKTKQYKKLTHLLKYRIEELEKIINQLHDDNHIACFSYPNCEEGPRGCIVLYGDEAEPYGHRP